MALDDTAEERGLRHSVPFAHPGQRLRHAVYFIEILGDWLGRAVIAWISRSVPRFPIALVADFAAIALSMRSPDLYRIRPGERHDPNNSAPD
jgi:hypothetical protein